MKIIGKYQIVEEISRSAAGVTCRARDPFRNREYALKILSPLAAISAASKDQLYRDLASSWELVHPHLAMIQDIGEVESIVYIATELLPGLALPSFLLSAELLSIPERLTLMAQVCEGLACAHSQGVAHGNLKPNNIFVTERRKAVVLDFGTGTWQQLLIASGVRLNGLLPNYLAPEQILGESFDGRSDIFSTGVLLYEILTGQYPFQAAAGVIPREIVHAQPQPLRQWNAQIPEELEQIVFRALGKDRRERFQTADEFAAHLHRIAEQMRREAMAPPVDLQPTPTESADVASVDVAAPASEMATPIAESVAAAEVIQPPPAVVEPAPAPAAVAPPPVPSMPPQYATAPVPAAMPVTPARPATPARTNPRKRRLITFAMGAAMALSMVGVIVVRQNMAAPGGSQKPAAQTPAAKQIAAPVVEEAAKPTPFVAPVAPAQPVAQEAPAQPAAEQVLRTQVRPLWEAGKYAEAMRLVDEVLVSNPASAEARGWQRRIRAAQEAEADIK
jgi:eukaryotic-like serine/threonine-protein kinase